MRQTGDAFWDAPEVNAPEVNAPDNLRKLARSVKQVLDDAGLDDCFILCGIGLDSVITAGELHQLCCGILEE